MTRPRPSTFFGAALLLAASVQLTAQDGDAVRAQLLDRLAWRDVGPVNFGGRIVDIEVHASQPSTFYVATASGGVFKSTNAGTSFAPIFDDQPSYSIGDLALAPSDADVLWVGTGEANNQRSSYWGDGVYKSTDGGRSFANMGLAGTDHIGRVAIHPEDHDIVFVAAAGALYRANDERGLYRTVDGGTSWERVAFVDADTGFIDVVIDPANPDVVYAASYQRRRRAHHFDPGGPGSGIWKSTDGGASFERLEQDLPDGDLGRIGLAVFPGNSQIVYATVENANADAIAAASSGRRRGGGSRNPDSGTGEIYRSEDGGESWAKVNEEPVGGRPGYYYGQILVDPNDDQVVYVLSIQTYKSTDGGKTFGSSYARGLHSDHHALWIDPRHSNHALIGNDGGIAETWDDGGQWDTLDHLPIAQFYAVATDLRTPYRIYGGTQDNGTWAIPSQADTTRGLTAVDAYKVNGGDGFYAAVDPTDPDVVYAESQFGSFTRVNLRTGARARIKPRADRGQPRLRCNWMSPFLISPHNPFTVYFGSQYLHRSSNRGEDWSTVSPDLTTNDAAKLAGNVPHCTLTTIAESPLREGLLWVGTDDGKVWVSRNGGDRWVDLSDRFPGLPRPLWVSRVEASCADEDVAYVAFTGYREDLRAPFLYLTTDGGETFRPIHNDLPQASINVVREHPRNPDVLFVGHEQGVHASLDGGASWHPLGRPKQAADDSGNGNGGGRRGGRRGARARQTSLPPTPVHDLVVHPREEDLVIATHGRGFWICDITPLAELSPELLQADAHLFATRDGRTPARAFNQGYAGSRGWTGPVPTSAATFHYLVGDGADRIDLEVLDASGEVLYRTRGSSEPGLHTVQWPQGRAGGGRGRGGRNARQAGPGQYVVRLRQGDTEQTRVFWLRATAVHAGEATAR